MAEQTLGVRCGMTARIALALAILLTPGVACAADAVARVAVTRVDPTVASAQALVGRLQPIGTFKHGDLLRFSGAGGALAAEIMPAARRAEQFRCKIEGSSADWVFAYREITVAGRPPTQSLVVQRYEFDRIQTGGVWSATFTIRAGTVASIDGRAGTGTDYGRVTVSTSGGALRFQLTGRKMTPDGRMIVVTGNTFYELRAKAPRTVREHLMPLVRSLCGEDVFAAAAGDVYRAWPDIPADQRVIERVRQVLPALDSPLPAERAAASQQLLNLGDAGVLAALRIDRTPLSPEQAGRLDAFIAHHEHRRFAAAQEARNDAWFLIDCLEFDDPAVRKLALDDLSRIWGKPIDFASDAPAPKRAESTDLLREAASAMLAVPAPATTRPAAHHLPFTPKPAVLE